MATTIGTSPAPRCISARHAALLAAGRNVSFSMPNGRCTTRGTPCAASLSTWPWLAANVASHASPMLRTRPQSGRIHLSAPLGLANRPTKARAKVSMKSACHQNVLTPTEPGRRPRSASGAR
jgi:hypothetical protein